MHRAPIEDDIMMDESMFRPMERIVHAAIRNQSRVIGFSGLRARSGTSTLAGIAATLMHRAGINVLLVDLTRPVQDGLGSTWTPGGSDASRAVARGERDINMLVAWPTPRTQFLFNNFEQLEETFAIELADFDRIIVDLPALDGSGSDRISAVAGAAACDELILVVPRGRVTADEAASAAEAARSLALPVTGAVLTSIDYRTVGDEIAGLGDRVRRVLPSFGRWIRRRATTSEFLR
jgi:hypothetical protein